MTYSQLPEQAKKIIDNTSDLKEYFDKTLDEIKRTEVKNLKNFDDLIQQLRTESQLIQNKQEKLSRSTSSLRSEVRDQCHDVRRHGVWGIQQINRTAASKQAGDLPIDFYLSNINRMGESLRIILSDACFLVS
jgi:hypothetical protein